MCSLGVSIFDTPMETIPLTAYFKKSLECRHVIRCLAILDSGIPIPGPLVRSLRTYNWKMEIEAIVFDVFGTLVEIGQPRRLYRQHLQLGGRIPQSSDGTLIMTQNVDLSGAATLLGIELPMETLLAFEKDLGVELTSVKRFPNTLSTLLSLVRKGYKIALCSNLAAP
jgi:hypothetical protein